MADSIIRRPTLLTIASTSEHSFYTIKPNANRVITLPLLLLFGFSIGVTDKPLRIRIREYPTDGTDATAITPKMVKHGNTDAARYAVNIQSAPPSGTEGPLAYDRWFFPQSVVADPWAHPQTHQPLIELSPGKFYHVTATHPVHGSDFDVGLEIVGSD